MPIAPGAAANASPLTAQPFLRGLQTSRQRRHLALPLVAAAAAHIALATLLMSLLSPYAKVRPTRVRAVHIRIIDKPKASVAPAVTVPRALPAKKSAVVAPAAGGRSGAAVKKPLVPPAPSAVATAAPRPVGQVVDRVAYETLLPSKETNQLELDGPAQGSAPAAYRHGSTAASISAEEVLGHLDIPLVYRRGGSTVKALAKLRRRDDRAAGWVFESVDGEPLLRAVLFEALRDERQARLIADLFRNLASREVLISLRQRTVVRPAGGTEYDENVHVEGTKIVVERTVYTKIDTGSLPLPLLAMELPDAEADRAKLRDRVQMQRLANSPAYLSPLRDRDP